MPGPLAGIDGFPRIRLGHAPTPLDAAPNLGAALDIELWIKRDDCTGLALGGYKVRQLEFCLGEAQARGAVVLDADARDPLIHSTRAHSGNSHTTSAHHFETAMPAHGRWRQGTARSVARSGRLQQPARAGGTAHGQRMRPGHLPASAGPYPSRDAPCGACGCCRKGTDAATFGLTRRPVRGRMTRTGREAAS